MTYSAGNVPNVGRMPHQPQSAAGSMALIFISSISPGIAPATAIGPVRICGPICGSFAARIASRAGAKVNPISGTASAQSVIVSTTTTSPDWMVSTGGTSAAKMPKLIVSGVAARL